MLIALLWPGVTLNGEEIRPKFNNVSRRELPRPGYSCYARGQIEFQLMQQRSLVPSEPLTWARTHGKRGLQARFKSSRFEDVAQSHWNVTDLLVTSHKTSKDLMKNLFSSNPSNWSLYYCTLSIRHHSTSLYNSLCNFSSFSTTYRCIQDHGVRKGEVWQCSPSMSMRWRWIKTFPTFLPVLHVRTLSPAKVLLQLPRPIEQNYFDTFDMIWLLHWSLLLLNAGCMYLVQSRSHVLDLQCKIKIGFEILIPVVS